MELRQFIRNAIRGYLHEQKSFDDVKLNDNFWEWFGDSKTTKNNEPLIFFHGTNVFFDTFLVKRRGAFGIGYYFTTDLKEAKDYGNKIMNVYLKIENPASPKQMKDIMVSIPDSRYLDYYDLGNKITEKLVENGFDGILFTYQNGDLLAMVINSNQIKSVHNDGSWDADDDNIYS